MTDTYRIGIIGAGSVGDLHARAISDLSNATLVAASRRTEESGRAFAETHGCKWYADYEALLDDARPDIVTIGTPSGAHLGPTISAAKRGIHVLCEKPLEITVDRVDRMIEAAQTHDVKLGGIFQHRFSGAIQTVHDAVDAGRFGSLAVASTSVPWWRDDAYYRGTWKGTKALDGGGALINQSIHAIDALAWIARADMDLRIGTNPVEEVYAYTSVRSHDPSHIEGEDTAVAAIKFRNGTLGTLLGATSMYPGTRRRLRVAGRNGTAEIQEDELTVWKPRNARPEDDEIRSRYGASSGKGGASDPMAIEYAKHKKNLHAFLDWVDRDADFLLPAAEARTAVSIITAVYESAETGEPVMLAP